jgi:hypothetical protein
MVSRKEMKWNWRSRRRPEMGEELGESRAS